MGSHRQSERESDFAHLVRKARALLVSPPAEQSNWRTPPLELKDDDIVIDGTAPFSPRTSSDRLYARHAQGP